MLKKSAEAQRRKGASPKQHSKRVPLWTLHQAHLEKCLGAAVLRGRIHVLQVFVACVHTLEHVDLEESLFRLHSDNPPALA